jgi:hypothetical protein
MTLQELDEKLRSLSNEELQKFNDDFGSGQKTIEDRVREFVDDPRHERRICQLLGLRTEEEKLTEASIVSSRAAFESARSARWSFIITIVVVLVSIAGLVLYIYPTLIQYNDLKATVLGVSPSFNSKLCTVDIVFTNNGNQQCSIAVVNLIEKHIDKTDPANPPRGAEIFIPFSNQPSFTINSRNVISKQFTISGKGKITDSGFTGLKNREWQLGFCVIDSEGKYHIIKVPVFWTTSEANQMKIIKYPFVVKLLPSPPVEAASLSLPLIRPANQ